MLESRQMLWLNKLQTEYIPIPLRQTGK